MIARYLFSFVVAAGSLLATGCSDPATAPGESSKPSLEKNAAAEPAVKTFSGVNGEVIKLTPGENTARIKHGEVPDYMPAMTMDLTVKDPAELSNLAEGDKITFRLNVTEDTHWIDQIVKAAAGGQNVAETPNNPFPTDKGWRRVRDVEPLDIGDVMPNYSFTNEFGKAVSLDELKGMPYAFTFIYTRCPIPDFCPRMSTQFMETQRLLLEMADAPEGWRLLSITMDPEFDTAAVLKGYASRYKYDPARWSFLTGPLIDITAITEQFGLMFYRPDESINHNLRTVVVDRAGKVHSIIMGNTWKAEDLVKSLVDAGKVKPETR